MKRLFVGSILVQAVLSSYVFAGCPDLSKGETQLDCPWANVTRDLDGVTEFRKIRKTLRKEIPGFMWRLREDASDRNLINLWGLSSNIDASQMATGNKTIPANILKYFVKVWGVPYNSEFTQGYAGLNHTYGYLFSNLQTPFGYKRARYVKGEIEAGFNLSDGTFSGLPAEGTLFANLTQFISPIAFRDNAEALDRFYLAVEDDEAIQVDEITNYDYSALKTKRLVEIVQNDEFYLELRTDIVPFIAKQTRGSDTALLIYSVDFRKPNEPANPLLITAFPVGDSMVNSIFNSANYGENKAIKLNYNALLPVTIAPEKLVGKRFVY